jgi:pimeloyl-ACP methyl ester carboxylesterase
MAMFLCGSISSAWAESGFGNGQNTVLIDHAINGSVVPASNYEGGIIPGGIGIPHTLINSLPEGDYFAVVFFDGLQGCPSDNYGINSFRANAYWGYDTIGPMQGFSKAWSTHAGGCEQAFHINPNRGDDWLWGAISNTGTSSAIADTNSIPAFAICATSEACDPITPHAGTEPLPSPDTNHPPQLSSILFLPGIKGSKLYEENPLCLIPGDGCDIPLWLPLSDASASELYMDENGKSTRNVYVKEDGILANAFGQHFYDAFSAKMDAYAANPQTSTGWKWKPIAYDWRMSLPDIVNNGAQHGDRVYYEESTSTPYIEQSLRELASSSPSGKVTIIAHSNGGLVAKALMQRLGDTEAAKLIDKVILVGVPQSGAPRALASALYGDSENLPGFGAFPNALLSRAHARTFALNSPMTYHLLPSSTYFQDVHDPLHPLVTFSDSSLFDAERTAYGNSIDSSNELRNYAAATEGGRTQPTANDLHDPNILNANLLTYADQTHSSLDMWQPPQGVKLYEIAGWGDDTLSGIELYEQQIKIHGALSSQRSYRPLFVEDGDGTVPVPSALMMNNAGSTKYWVNLPALGDSSHTYDHGTLFETPSVEELITNIIETNNALPSGVTTSQPAAVNPAKKLLFVLHGPASFTMHGSHSSTSILSESIGDASYAVVPADDIYTANIVGTDIGTITLDVATMLNGIRSSVRTIASVPVTQSTVANVTIPNDSADIASTTVLTVDQTNDGSIDITIPFLSSGTTFPADEIATQTPSTPVTIPQQTSSVAPVTTPIVSSSGGGVSGSVSKKIAAVVRTAIQPKVVPVKVIKNVIAKAKPKAKVVKKPVKKVLKVVKAKTLAKAKVAGKPVCTKTYCPVSTRKIQVTSKSSGPAKK